MVSPRHLRARTTHDIVKTFAGVPTEGNCPFDYSQYATYEACEIVVHSFLEDMEINQYRAAKLLGFERTGDFSRYFNGERRPSQLMTMRMHILRDWKKKTDLIPKIHRIDWNRGEIEWMKGYAPQQDNTTAA